MKKLTAMIILFAISAVFLIACAESIDKSTSEISDESISSRTETSDILISESTAESSTAEISNEISDTESEPDDESSPDKEGEPDAPYLFIGGTETFDDIRRDILGDGTVTAEYNRAEDRIELTLNNAKIDAMPILSDDPEALYGIYSNKSLVIELVGENRINIDVPNIDYYYCFGIAVFLREQYCSFSGDGSLEIKTNAQSDAGCAVVAGIEAATVKIRSGAEIKIEVDGGIAATYGISAGNITVSDQSSIDVYGGGNEPHIPSAMYIYGPIVSVEDNAEAIFRGNNSVSENNIFYLAHGEYLNQAYISEYPSGKNAKKAEIIHDTIVGASKKNEIGINKYFRITSRDGNKLPIWVGGTNLTTDNANDIFDDGSASYDTETNTLTLDNADIQGGKQASVFSGRCEYAIWSAADLNIVLKGDSRVACVSDEVTESFAIYCKKLTASGSGKLTAKACKGNGELGFSVGIFCESYLQKEGTVFAISAEANDSEGYTVSAGIYSKGSIALEKGTVYAECGEAGYANDASPFAFVYPAEAELIYPENALTEQGETKDGKEYMKITAQ